MSTTTTTVVTVQGMSCGHCVTSVTNEVTKIAGVKDVAVDLASGVVEIRSDEPLDLDTIAAAVDEAGYEVTS